MISAQDMNHSKKTVEEIGLTYPVLSDLHNKVAGEFGLVYEYSPELKEAYLELGMDISEYNADDSWTLPIPATYIIAPSGVIETAFVSADYTQRMEPAEVVAELKKVA
jgi:peroxiredoxin